MTKLLLTISILMMSLSSFAYEGPEFNQPNKSENTVRIFDGGDMYLVEEGEKTEIYNNQGLMVASIETKKLPSLLSIIKSAFGNVTEKMRENRKNKPEQYSNWKP